MALVAVACAEPAPTGGHTVILGFDGGLWDSPLPGDHRLRADGTVRLQGWPNPDHVEMVDAVVDLIDGEARGFGTTSAVFLPLTGPVDPATLPDLHASTEAGASVFLTPVDPAVPEYGTGLPVEVAFLEDPGPFGPDDLLAVLPLQGVPLRPATRYAAVVTTDVADARGRPLAVAPAVRALATGDVPAGLAPEQAASWRAGLAAAAARGVPASRVAGLTVFTTDRPVDPLYALADQVRAEHALAVAAEPELVDTHDNYCVYRTTVDMPVFQEGDPPYLEGGGAIRFDAAGQGIVDHHEQARLFLTVPRQTPPEAGWPVAVMVRTGGGGDRPLVDRGPRDAGGELIEPGTGPALDFARAGFAGASVDGPHGGIRNVSGGDEQFLIFNIGNPAAMRDNLRQSAVELALLPDLLAGLDLDTGDCPGTGEATAFDPDTLALVGHSMGATIAPLTLAVEPRYRAAVLSGAGGSWIENVVHKQSPLPVRPIAEAMLEYDDRDLHAHDPFLNLLQWAGEPADPPVYARPLVAEPGAGAPLDVLVIQGIVDTYILPPIANALTVSLGLDLAGPALDAGHPDLQGFRPLAEVVAYGGGTAVDLPASGNRGGATAVVVQHLEDGIEDGHEVLFQRPEPRAQMRCFLRGFAQGVAPTVPVEGCDP